MPSPLRLACTFLAEGGEKRMVRFFAGTAVESTKEEQAAPDATTGHLRRESGNSSVVRMEPMLQKRLTFKVEMPQHPRRHRGSMMAHC